METIQELEKEHAEVYGLMEKLAEAAQSLRKGAPGVQPENASVLQGFLTAWHQTINRHFRIEEQALFPVLGRHIGTQGGPIAVMLLEHEELQEAVNRLEEEVAKAKPEPEELARLAGTIASTLDPHARKEDQILFDIARQVLSADELAEVNNLAASVE